MDQRRSRKEAPTTKELQKPEPHYTVFVRLPFARNEFVDPPQVSTITHISSHI